MTPPPDILLLRLQVTQFLIPMPENLVARVEHQHIVRLRRTNQLWNPTNGRVLEEAPQQLSERSDPAESLRSADRSLRPEAPILEAVPVSRVNRPDDEISNNPILESVTVFLPNHCK